MIKIENAGQAQCALNCEKPAAREPQQEVCSADSVNISEECKRRHVLGHVLASISEAGHGKEK